MKERYARNLGALSREESERLRTKRACVVGCGGIGGYVVELLSRIGIGTLTALDGDCFALSNLNRQLLSNEALIGQSKTAAACERIHSINSEVHFNAASCFITAENADSILREHDIVIDALDNIPARRIIAESCDRLDIPLVHCAVYGWCAQVSVILPGSHALDKIYPAAAVQRKKPTCLSFTPALAASIQAAEAVKVLLGKEAPLQSKLLLVDLFTQDYSTVIL